jgi:hypothetical protein
VTDARPVDRVEVHVLVDNVTDSLSTVPSFVENEWGYLWRNGMKKLSGRFRLRLAAARARKSFVQPSGATKPIWFTY